MITMTNRTAALKAARTKDSTDKRGRVLAALNTMQTSGQPITAAAVAAAAGVSTWLVYADGIREHFQAARQHQATTGTTTTKPRPDHQPATPASLRTDLAIARSEIHRLRNDLNKMRERLRLQLGAEIEQPDRAELIARVGALESANQQFLAERDARAHEADTAQRRVSELEDELTAARESLRRVIRATNR